MKKTKVIAVVGATASGKTSLAVEIAKAVGGEVISADSMQIYKGMTIATAQPSEEEKQGIPHHLIAFLEPDETYSVAQFVEDAKGCIADITSRGKVPVIAGGTGLYTDSLLGGVDFGEVPDNQEMRASLKERLEAEGAEALLDELNDLKLGNISDYEMEKVKNKFEANTLMGEINVMNKAMNLGFYSMTGRIELINEETDIFRSITREEIMAFATERFTAENSSTIIYRAQL